MHFWTNLLTQYLPQPSMFRAPDVEMADPLESKREHVSFLMRYHQQRLRKNVDNNPPAIIPDSNLAAGATAGAGVPSPTGKVEVLDIYKDFLAVSESMTKKDPVIATMVSSQTDKYLKCLQYFLLSLEASGYNSEVLIIITENPDPLRRSFSPDPNRLEKLSMPYEGKLVLKEIYVPTIEITKHFNKDSQKDSKAMAKIHLWALHTYSIIVYYDLDFIFLRNPIPAATTVCALTKSDFCATEDEGMVKYFGRPPGKYFNSGFMVLKPSLPAYANLLSKKHLAESSQFPDQDFLNLIFADNWGRLSEEFNRMHISNIHLKHVHGGINSNTVALHEKYWVLRDIFPDKNFIWNRIKLRR